MSKWPKRSLDSLRIFGGEFHWNSETNGKGFPEFGTCRNFGVHHTGSVQGLQVVQRMSMFPARRRAPALSCVFFMTASHHSAIAWGLHELMI